MKTFGFCYLVSNKKVADFSRDQFFLKGISKMTLSEEVTGFFSRKEQKEPSASTERTAKCRRTQLVTRGDNNFPALAWQFSNCSLVQLAFLVFILWDILPWSEKMMVILIIIFEKFSKIWKRDRGNLWSVVESKRNKEKATLILKDHRKETFQATIEQ